MHSFQRIPSHRRAFLPFFPFSRNIPLVPITWLTFFPPLFFAVPAVLCVLYIKAAGEDLRQPTRFYPLLLRRIRRPRPELRNLPFLRGFRYPYDPLTLYAFFSFLIPSFPANGKPSLSPPLFPRHSAMLISYPLLYQPTFFMELLVVGPPLQVYCPPA